VCVPGPPWARGCPRHLAGRSLRASCPPLTRRKPHFALQAPLGFLRRSIGTGSPSQHQPSHVIPEEGAAGSEARAEAGATCAPPGCAEGKGNRTHKSRRRRACLRPAAVPRRQATINCESHCASRQEAGRRPARRTPTPGSRLPGPWMGRCRAGESLRAFGGLRVCRQEAGRRPARRTPTPGSRLPGPWMARQPYSQNVRLSSAKTSRLS